MDAQIFQFYLLDFSNSLSEGFNISADNISVTSIEDNSTTTDKLRVKLRVGETNELPPQPPSNEALWSYVILKPVSWKSLFGDDETLSVRQNIDTYILS